MSLGFVEAKALKKLTWCNCHLGPADSHCTPPTLTLMTRSSLSPAHQLGPLGCPRSRYMLMGVVSIWQLPGLSHPRDARLPHPPTRKPR